MIRALSIDAEWETLRQGSAEERACFAALGIQYGDIWLTEAEDAFVKRVRSKVHLSAYHFAEWLAWNWWRLRWEPRKHAPGWNLAHRMATIGGGYVWPMSRFFPMANGWSCWRSRVNHVPRNRCATLPMSPRSFEPLNSRL